MIFDNQVIVLNKFKWFNYKFEHISIHLTVRMPENLIHELLNVLNNRDHSFILNNFKKVLDKRLTMQYSIIVHAPDFLIAAVDAIRSYPIYFTKNGDFIISDDFKTIFNKLNINKYSSIDQFAISQIALSGFLSSRGTISKNVETLSAQECVMFSNGHRRFYRKNSFIPTENNKKPDTNEFTRLLLSIFDDMTKQLNGKHIFVPLSAGYDSRLVVSALKMCDYREVTCFYYGRDGSFEQSASKKIADRLGYDWIDVRLDDRFMKSFFSSDMFNKYVDYSDNGFSVPFVQDIAALSKMFESNQIDKDACVINGNSGDFISGGHIPSELKLETPEYVNFNTLSENIFNPFYEKHFKLWNKLGNDILKNKIRSTLETSLFEILNNNNVAAIDSSLKYELLEYYGRQSSYVVSAQRTYDFFGLDWKLPLWDTRIIDYFFSISPEYKYDQGFYKDTLINNNWCNVWHDIPLNKKTLYSYKIIIPRTLAKVMSAPFGKSNWHKVERRFFNYWLDDTRNSCENTYYAYLKNSFDARNRVSFQAEKYINNYKFSLDVVNKYKD